MTLPLYAVYGVSGCGRGIMPLARDMLQQQGIPSSRLVFIDDNPDADTVQWPLRFFVMRTFWHLMRICPPCGDWHCQ
jgi:hypothetical protein